MSLDLTVSGPINPTTQLVMDQDQNPSAVWLSTTTLNLPPESRLVFGVNVATGGGFGEWMQNTAGITPGTFGISFFSNSTEQLRVQNTLVTVLGNLTVQGDLTLQNDLTIQNLTVQNDLTIQNLKSGSGMDLVADPNGQVYLQSSSARHKEDIADFKDDFGKVFALQPVSFRYRESGHEAIGYLAESLHAAGLEKLVTYDAEGQPFAINYKLLPVYLLEIVKDQQKRIEELQARVGA